MRKNIKKTMCMLLAIIMILSSSMVMFADEKVYFTGTIDDITVDDKLWVTILHEHSGLDKQFSQADFPGVEITDIRYVTSLKDPNKDYPYLNVNEYRQLLVLTLAEPGKENVLEAIRTLENNPIVRGVLPYPSAQPGDEGETGWIDGDVNLDSEVNAKDALIILKASAKLCELTEEEKVYADVRNDNLINAEDALIVLKMAARLW